MRDGVHLGEVSLCEFIIEGVFESTYPLHPSLVNPTAATASHPDTTATGCLSNSKVLCEWETKVSEVSSVKSHDDRLLLTSFPK